MGFVLDSTGSHRYGGPTSNALLAAFGMTSEWRTGLVACRTVVADKVSALSDNAAGGTLSVAQGNAANRPALVVGPPDVAQLDNLTHLYLECAGSIDPNANLTLVAAFDATGNVGGGMQTVLSVCSTTTAASWQLGYQPSGNLCILRRYSDAGFNAQLIPAGATGKIVLVGTIGAGVMNLSVNGAPLAGAGATSGTFTATSMRTVLGAANTSIGVDNSGGAKLGFAAMKNGLVSSADCAAIYPIALAQI